MCLLILVLIVSGFRFDLNDVDLFTDQCDMVILDKPSPPGAPIVEEVGGDYVNLSWAKADDGGGRLLGYIIEKREAGSDRWSRVNHQPVKTLSYNVMNLIEDSSYHFRVIAINLAGESKPSDESTKIVVKDPKGINIDRLTKSCRADKTLP